MPCCWLLNKRRVTSQHRFHYRLSSLQPNIQTFFTVHLSYLLPCYFPEAIFSMKAGDILSTFFIGCFVHRSFTRRQEALQIGGKNASICGVRAPLVPPRVIIWLYRVQSRAERLCAFSTHIRKTLCALQINIWIIFRASILWTHGGHLSAAGFTFTVCFIA